MCWCLHIHLLQNSEEILDSQPLFFLIFGILIFFMFYFSGEYARKIAEENKRTQEAEKLIRCLILMRMSLFDIVESKREKFHASNLKLFIYFANDYYFIVSFFKYARKRRIGAY